MGKYYTELFFLDEVTALAAGHRPCFECRRTHAVNFAEIWQKVQGLDDRPNVKAMDTQLHAERLHHREKRTFQIQWKDMPSGAMYCDNGVFFAKHDDQALVWSESGYRKADAKTPRPGKELTCLTPPTIVGVLRGGYRPQWHPSAQLLSQSAH